MEASVVLGNGASPDVDDMFCSRIGALLKWCPSSGVLSLR